MSRDPYCICPSCLGTQIKDEECHMTKYNCNCDASAGAPDHARTCPQHRDFGKISGKDIVDAYESRGASIGAGQPALANSPQLDIYAAGAAACDTGTSPQSPGCSYHPLVNIAEWRKGCSCAPKDHPVQCEQCTEGLIQAVENWFTEHRSRRILGTAKLLEDLDARAGLPETVYGRAAEIIRHLESELYAADDQVAGLQELMRAHVTEKHLLDAVRHLVDVAAEDDGGGSGSPHHGHSILGRWDGDSKHKKGDLCEECAAWDTLRKYASQDIKAVETVSREAELHAALVKAQKVIDMLFPGVSKIFGVDFQELNESCAAVSQALKGGKPKCSCCGLTDVSLELSCHNSDCQGYAEQVTVYEGWK